MSNFYQMHFDTSSVVIGHILEFTSHFFQTPWLIDDDDDTESFPNWVSHTCKQIQMWIDNLTPRHPLKLLDGTRRNPWEAKLIFRWTLNMVYQTVMLSRDKVFRDTIDLIICCYHPEDVTSVAMAETAMTSAQRVWDLINEW